MHQWLTPMLPFMSLSDTSTSMALLMLILNAPIRHITTPQSLVMRLEVISLARKPILLMHQMALVRDSQPRYLPEQVKMQKELLEMMQLKVLMRLIKVVPLMLVQLAQHLLVVNRHGDLQEQTMQMFSITQPILLNISKDSKPDLKKYGAREHLYIGMQERVWKKVNSQRLWNSLKIRLKSTLN